MGFLGFNFNLRDQLAFYGSYHTHPGNKLIHFVFVPLIFWSVIVWMDYLPQISDKLDLPGALSSFLPEAFAGLFVFNWAALVVIVYGVYYTVLEPFAGASWFVCQGIPVIVVARLFFIHVPYAWAPAIGLHILGWVMQISVGHAMLELRKPALLDSFFQSLVLAGLFAWMEGLFALGYRPKLQAELDRIIEARVEEWNANSSKQPLMKSVSSDSVH